MRLDGWPGPQLHSYHSAKSILWARCTALLKECILNAPHYTTSPNWPDPLRPNCLFHTLWTH